MTCEPFSLADGTHGFICSRGKRRAAPCFYCSAPHIRLCDAKIGPRKTCNRKLCAKHGVSIGPDRDLCPAHIAAPKANDNDGSSEPCKVFTGNCNAHRRDAHAFDVTRRRTVGVPLTKAQFATLALLARKRSKSSVLLEGLALLEQTIAPATPPAAPRTGERSKHASAYLGLEACTRLRRLCLLFRWNESEVLRAALECIAQQKEQEDDHGHKNRMDARSGRIPRGNLEPRSGVHENIAGLQELLCNGTGAPLLGTG